MTSDDCDPTPALPDLDDLLDQALVVALPMRVRFRGTVEREALLLRGPAGWGEFSPFAEYDDEEAAWWLLSAVDAAWCGFPEPLRDPLHVGFVGAFDDVLLVAALVALAGAVLTFALVRQKDFVRPPSH